MIDLLGPAQRCLDHFVTYWGERGWNLPERRYIAPGVASAIADDAEQFVIGLTSIVPGGGRGGAPARGAGAANTPSATYAARLIRCTYATDEMVPDAELIHVDGRQSLLDAGRILSTLIDWAQTEPVAVSLNATTVIGELQPVGPEGAVMGHVAPFTLSQFHQVAD